VPVDGRMRAADGLWAATRPIGTTGSNASVRVPTRRPAVFKLDTPELTGDVVPLHGLPTSAMAQALQTIAGKGSSGRLAYRVSASASAKPEQEDKPRDFDFNGNDWISPVPGMNTWPVPSSQSM